MKESERKEMERLKEIENKHKARNKSINETIKNNFDRVSAALPKGTKERIKNAGYSVNDFIVKSVLEKLEAIEDK